MQIKSPSRRRLLLIIVAYHPSLEEVELLQSSLVQLDPEIGYVVVANDYFQPEPIDQLRQTADVFLESRENCGYGRAVNYALSCLHDVPEYIAALNTDLTWDKNTFESMVQWLDLNRQVCLATPMILNEQGQIQYLCKRHPTVLALLSRRFWPDWLKPQSLQRYDRRFVMMDHDYTSVFTVPYLSGCCMLMRSRIFLDVGGFDERYFLYLEDADLTRMMSERGLCVHLPFVKVVHRWGRGSYRNLFLALVNIQSAWLYFAKWGLRWI
jgi:GT2 family glycosyltransferase